MAQRFLRRPEVLARLGIKREALRELINDDHFPPGTQIVPGGRAQGWLESDVDLYIEARRKLAHKEKGVFPTKKASATKTMEVSNDDESRHRPSHVVGTNKPRSGQHRPRTGSATRGSTRSHK